MHFIGNVQKTQQQQQQKKVTLKAKTSASLTETSRNSIYSKGVNKKEMQYFL